MERQREREREPEPRERAHDYDWNEARAERWALESRLFQERPRVVKYDAVPWEQVQQAYHKIYTGDNLPDIPRKLRRAPIFTMSARLQVIETGHKSGNHRHYHEAVFYVLEGRGHDVHDGRRYDWEPGDLMIVPGYCAHQHFCDDGPTTLFYVLGDLAPNVGLGAMEQLELNARFKLPPGARLLHDDRGEVTGYRRKDGTDILFREYAIGHEAMTTRRQLVSPQHPVTDGYEHYIRLLQEEVHLRQSVPHVIKPQDCRWEDTRYGRIMWMCHPARPTGIRTYEVYVQELPPGKRSGRHRHVGEEVYYIVEGKGYTVIDDQTWEWQAGDVVAIPVCSAHQSFNADQGRKARFVAVRSTIYDFMGFGGIEHLEDAT